MSYFEASLLNVQVSSRNGKDSLSDAVSHEESNGGSLRAVGETVDHEKWVQTQK